MLESQLASCSTTLYIYLNFDAPQFQKGTVHYELDLIGLKI